MRHSLIVASFALALLAAPVPQKETRALQNHAIRGDEGWVNDGGIQQRDLQARETYQRDSQAQETYKRALQAQEISERDPQAQEPYKREPAAEAEPFLPFDGQKREAEAEAEAEPLLRPGGQERKTEAKPEVLLRPTGQKREANAQRGGIRESGKREADTDAEALLRFDRQKREAEADPAFRTPLKNSGNLKPRNIWNSAVGIVEALKTRGFSSNMLIDPK